jgi:hypothetical protein
MLYHLNHWYINYHFKNTILNSPYTKQALHKTQKLYIYLMANKEEPKQFFMHNFVNTLVTE